ncbi:MAG: hypothetical protein EOL97_14485 [Spirochaetia bacterium]|nr:hypothetical protein [Spirochaetia bacterium]
MGEIVEFPDNIKTNNLESVVEETIKKCELVEPKIKRCNDCKKILEENDIGGKSVSFEYHSTPIYFCKECEELNEIIFNFLQEVSYHNFGTKELRCDWNDFMEDKIKKLLKTKTPKKYIKKYNIKFKIF